MSIPRPLKQLSKFLTYVLQKNPYEFGLVPDENGFVKTGDLLKALNEEEGWRHIRLGSITELIHTMPEPPVEISENLIRHINLESLQKPVFAETLPKLLYTCIRKKAHFHVSKRGIDPPQDIDYVILSSDEAFALKVGKRKDKTPVLLTVNTNMAENSGVFFFHAGESVYLARHIPPDCFTGPPLPEAKPNNSKKTTTPSAKKSKPSEPGSYFPELKNPEEPGQNNYGKRDKKSWKENRKKLRKQKKAYYDDY